MTGCQHIYLTVLFRMPSFGIHLVCFLLIVSYIAINFWQRIFNMYFKVYFDMSALLQFLHGNMSYKQSQFYQKCQVTQRTIDRINLIIITGVMSVLHYFGMIAMEIFNSLVSLARSFFRDTAVRIYKCPKEQLY